MGLVNPIQQSWNAYGKSGNKSAGSQYGSGQAYSGNINPEDLAVVKEGRKSETQDYDYSSSGGSGDWRDFYDPNKEYGQNNAGNAGPMKGEGYNAERDGDYDAWKAQRRAYRARFQEGGDAYERQRAQEYAILAARPKSKEELARLLNEMGIYDRPDQGQARFRSLMMDFENKINGNYHYDDAGNKYDVATSDVNPDSPTSRGTAQPMTGADWADRAKGFYGRLEEKLGAKTFQQLANSGEAGLQRDNKTGLWYNDRPDGTRIYYNDIGYRVDPNTGQEYGHYMFNSNGASGGGQQSQGQQQAATTQTTNTQTSADGTSYAEYNEDGTTTNTGTTTTSGKGDLSAQTYDEGGDDYGGGGSGNPGGDDYKRTTKDTSSGSGDAGDSGVDYSYVNYDPNYDWLQYNPTGPSAQEQELIGLLTELARAIQGQSQGLFHIGLPAYAKAIEYYQKLLGGDRGAMWGAVAPSAELIADSYKGLRGNISGGMLRGGAREAALGETARQQGADVAHLIQGVQPQAANALMSGGLAGVSQSTQTAGVGAGIYNSILSNLTQGRLAEASLMQNSKQFSAGLSEQVRANNMNYNQAMAALAMKDWMFKTNFAEQVRQWEKDFGFKSEWANKYFNFEQDKWSWTRNQAEQQREDEKWQSIAEMIVGTGSKFIKPRV